MKHKWPSAFHFLQLKKQNITGGGGMYFWIFVNCKIPAIFNKTQRALSDKTVLQENVENCE